MSALAYSTRDAAQIAGVSYRALLTAMNAGDLAYFVPSGCKRKRYVRMDELRRWIRSMKGSAPRMA